MSDIDSAYEALRTARARAEHRRPAILAAKEFLPDVESVTLDGVMDWNRSIRLSAAARRALAEAVDAEVIEIDNAVLEAEARIQVSE